MKFILMLALFVFKLTNMLFASETLSTIDLKDSMSIQTHSLYKMIESNPFVIKPEKVQEITKHLGITVEELLRLLIPVAQTFARPPISNYKVGIAALGESGTIYLGVNLEFLGLPLNEAVHGEQFLIANARRCGETKLIAMALSAAPCGHCRQFMNEMDLKGDLQILLPSSNETLSSLLPSSFGPKDLGLEGGLMPSNGASAHQKTSLEDKALQAAISSYAPYSRSKSGIALQIADGSIYVGSYLENAAFNPSLSPMQAALVALVADRKEFCEIERALLIEETDALISQELMSKELLKKVAPKAVFVYHKQRF